MFVEVSCMFNDAGLWESCAAPAASSRGPQSWVTRGVALRLMSCGGQGTARLRDLEPGLLWLFSAELTLLLFSEGSLASALRWACTSRSTS